MPPSTKQNASAESKIFNIPPGVLFLASVMFAVELVRVMLPEDLDLYVLLTLAVIPERVTILSDQFPGGSLSIWTSFITYLFIHGGWAHLIFNTASLVAFGGALEQRLGIFRMAALFFFSGLLAALGFIVVHPHIYTPMIGASGAISGLLGGLMRVFFSVFAYKQENNLNFSHLTVPLMPLSVALRDHKIQAVTLAFVLLNVATLFGIQDVNIQGAIAWEAHVAGYLAGFCLIGLLDVATHQEL